VNDPLDRVLVCVLNRRRDFEQVRDGRWYRIPQAEMMDGVHAEILAFFFSRTFGDLNGAIHCYAAVTGVELAYREWLLPGETAHPHATSIYYRVALGPLQRKHPPVANLEKRPIAFIRTTWERFAPARAVSDLYLHR
jgi:hypothetical protein